MAWTYTNAPATVERDAVRLLCGDTNSADQLVSDEEIAYFLATEAGVSMAAASACEAIAAKLARKEGSVSRRSGSISSTGSASYLEKAKTLRRRAAMSAEWFFGGQTKSGKAALRADSDAVQPHFTVGRDDHPATSDCLRRSDCDD